MIKMKPGTTYPSTMSCHYNTYVFHNSKCMQFFPDPDKVYL